MSRLRTVKLMPDVDQKLAAYARARRITPEQAAAEAIEQHLRDTGDIASRIADARRALQKHRDG